MTEGAPLSEKLERISKEILDPCCGSRMFWFNKNHPDVLYCDIREESHILCDGRTLSISPDLKIDFRKMPFEDDKFSLVVFDPPHLAGAGKSGWQAKKYGSLSADWQSDIKKGFDECMRVLRPRGVLIFKWNEQSIKVNKLLEIIKINPLFGHRTLQSSKTIWMTFFKTSKGDQ